jgi:hypothetical protein
MARWLELIYSFDSYVLHAESSRRERVRAWVRMMIPGGRTLFRSSSENWGKSQNRKNQGRNLLSKIRTYSKQGFGEGCESCLECPCISSSFVSGVRFLINEFICTQCPQTSTCNFLIIVNCPCSSATFKAGNFKRMFYPLFSVHIFERFVFMWLLLCPTIDCFGWCASILYFWVIFSSLHCVWMRSDWALVKNRLLILFCFWNSKPPFCLSLSNWPLHLQAFWSLSFSSWCKWVYAN